jgi:hypothetical protein
MADFTGSGIEGLPIMTADSLQKGGDPRVLGWLREAVVEGDRINRSDPSFDMAEVGMRYVGGDQGATQGSLGESPGYLSRLMINDSRRVTQAHVSALTDLNPLFAYKATNPAFSLQCDLVNRLLVAWWVTQQVDIALGDCAKYALAAGTGDFLQEWDPNAGFGGDVVCHPRDFRDTIPWRPAPQQRSIQAWEGLILRESHTVNVMRSLYPEKADLFRPTTDSLLSTLMGRWRSVVSRLMTPADDTLSGLNAPTMSARTRSGEILLYRSYLNDRTRNLTPNPIPMGRPGASWSYMVPPGGYLYPFKRLVVSTPDMMLYDGPNPYWHGQYPVSRLMLWSLPWQFLGRGLLHDLIPLQNAINQSAQDVFLAIRQWLDPTVLYNKGAVSESFMRLFDPRRTGAKVKLNELGAKEGFKKLDGPPPQVIALALETLDKFRDYFNDLSGTPNLMQLLELRQLPNADTLSAYWQAMTPELRQEGRQLEAFLRSVAEQHKCLRFQFETNARRVTILGDAGQLLQDFDFDPEQMVPAMQPGDPGYQPELDASKPRSSRAQAFQKTIVFTIAPNSILAMNAQEKKLITLQNFRMGVVDFWTYHEVMETPNVGAPPPIPLPPLQPPTPQMVQQSMLAGEGKYTLDPMSGAILEIRTPITITERLQAQQMLGIGLTQSPASGQRPPSEGGGGGDSGGGPGRKASGQAPPKVEQKSDGRTTVTESQHKPGPNG